MGERERAVKDRDQARGRKMERERERRCKGEREKESRGKGERWEGRRGEGEREEERGGEGEREKERREADQTAEADRFSVGKIGRVDVREGTERLVGRRAHLPSRGAPHQHLAPSRGRAERGEGARERERADGCGVKRRTPSLSPSGSLLRARRALMCRARRSVQRSAGGASTRTAVLMTGPPAPTPLHTVTAEAGSRAASL